MSDIEILQNEIKNLKEEFAEHKKEDAERLGHIEDKLDTILLTLSRYKGAIGGIIFVLSSIWGIVTFVMSYLGKG